MASTTGVPDGICGSATSGTIELSNRLLWVRPLMKEAICWEFTSVWAKLSKHYRLGVVWLPQLVFRMAYVDRLRAAQLSCQTSYSGSARS